MMKCKICDAEVSSDAAYCQSCGARVDQQADDSSPEDRFAPPPADGPAETAAEALGAAIGSRRRADDPELELWKGGYSPKAMVGAFILGDTVCAGLFIAAIYFGGSPMWWICGGTFVLVLGYLGFCLLYRKMNVTYRLTTQRFFHETGILRRVTDRIEVIDMDDITFEQGLIERFLGVGTIRVTSSDRTHPELLLVGIDDVKDVAAKIDQARRDERVRRGLHIEAI